MPQQKQLSPLETLIEDLKFLEDKADDVVAKLAYNTAGHLCKSHLKKESLLPQEQVTPDGYIFQGRLFTTVDEIKGQTFSDGNSPVAIYFMPQKQVKVDAGESEKEFTDVDIDERASAWAKKVSISDISTGVHARDYKQGFKDCQFLSKNNQVEVVNNEKFIAPDNVEVAFAPMKRQVRIKYDIT